MVNGSYRNQCIIEAMSFTPETATKAIKKRWEVPKTLDDRAAEMKARLLAKERDSAKIPRRFVDPEARLLRLKAIRARIDFTQKQMAEAVGLVLSVYKDFECGRRTPVTWPVLKLAEVELKRFIIRTKKNRQNARRRILADPPLGVPDDPALRAKILAMHVRGETVGEIAVKTALRLEVAEYLLAQAESQGYRG